MKRCLPFLLFTCTLILFTLQNNNPVYGRDPRIHKGQSLSTNFFTGGRNSIHATHPDRIVNTIPTLYVNLYLLNPDSSVKLADGATAQYDSLFSATLNYMDAPKMMNINENLAFLLDGKLLSIERKPPIHLNDTLYLSLTNTTVRSYQFQISGISLSQPGLLAFLKDSYTGDSTFIDLDGFSTYNFAITGDAASENPNRFTIVYETPLAAGPLPVTYQNVKAWLQNGNIDLEWNVNNELNIKNYTVERSSDGHTFSSIGEIASNSNNSVSDIYQWVDEHPGTGENFYRICCTGSNGNIQYSQVVKVINGLNNAGLSVYPNPVTGGVVGLQMANLAGGTYQLNLINSAGQLVATKQVSYNGGTATQTVSFGNNLPKGLFELEINEPGNHRVAYKVQFQ